MRLNPLKCAFGVTTGKFLGFMLTSRGIEANPEKCEAITQMRSPSSVKEVQQLTGRIAALSRFLSKSAYKSLPLFQLLKKGKDFKWTGECEAAFQELKVYLSQPPILSKPQEGETLFLYLSVNDEAVSAALVRELEEGQKPVYFVSKVLQEAEKRYQKIEKLAFALVTTSRRLRQYFQCHPMVVRT
ncbi:MAG: RNase H-like domain-containing protein, partial [Sweet potato little leaf phytoplasma]|nr:RNase H-like domain-containing protein [Sweet potato little leaf phytoplasma]